jgi:hypothetical protein
LTVTDGTVVVCRTNEAGYVPGVVGSDENLSVRVPEFFPILGETLSQVEEGVETVQLTVPLPDLVTATVCEAIGWPEEAVTLTGFGVTDSVWAAAETGRMSAHSSASDRTFKGGICMAAPSPAPNSIQSAPPRRRSVLQPAGVFLCALLYRIFNGRTAIVNDEGGTQEWYT